MLCIPTAVRTRRAVLALLVTTLALPAFAQRVVVFEFKGDVKGKLHRQVLGALEKAHKVEVVPLARFDRSAALKGFRGARARGPAAVAAVAPKLAVVIVVEGTVKRTFAVKMLDAQGQPIWGKNLVLRQGLLSPDHARKLAAAVDAAAVGAAGAAEPPPPPSAVVHESVSSTEPASPRSGNESSSKASPEPSLRGSSEAALHPSPLAESPSSEKSEKVTQTEARPRPFWVDGSVGATLTWRSYCARPGVSSCGAYNALPDGSKPPGNIVDFVPTVPYLGFEARVEAFPLASLDNPAKGFGIAGSLGEGFSLTQVTQSSASGTQPAKSVSSTDIAYQVAALWRYYFLMGLGDAKSSGYAGVRFGYGGRSFNVDPAAFVPLPGSHRKFPLIGIDASLPLYTFLRADVSVFYLLSPSPSANDTVNYGSSVSSKGLGFEAGVSGQIYGPFGYLAHFRYTRFSDTFTGVGVQWPTGGVAQESYAQANFSASLRF